VEEASRGMHRPAFFSDRGRQDRIAGAQGGGAEHGRWVFDYNVARDDDDEAGFLFGHHAFVPGEYVSISDAGGVMHTFVVKSVTSVNR